MKNKTCSLESKTRTNISGVDYTWPEPKIAAGQKIEGQLHESEASFRALTESSPAAILIWGDKTIRFTNRAFESISGFTKEEILEMRFQDLVHPDMPDDAEFQRVLHHQEESRSDRFELRILAKNGRVKWLDVATTAIKFNGETATLATACDITGSKQAEDSLKALKQELGQKAHDLAEMNAALKVLLKKRENDRDDLEGKLTLNIRQLIEPYLMKLQQTRLSPRQSSIISQIEANLNEINSSFARILVSDCYNLTSQEIRIATLIKQEKTTKEIAQLMSLSVRTIEFHRTKIRQKLGLKNLKSNLRSHLMSLN